MWTNDQTELKGLIANFDLLGYIQNDLGEVGEQRGDYWMFHSCVCGHHDCLSVFPKQGQADSFVCYSESSRTSNGDRLGGTIIDLLMFQHGLDRTEASKMFLRDFCGKKVSKRRSKEENVASVFENGENPYLEYNSSNGARKEPNQLAIQWWIEHDPKLDNIRFDTFRDTIVCDGGLPWDREVFEWREIDDLFLFTRLQEIYKIGKKDRVVDAIRQVAMIRKFDSLIEMFEQLPEWDGVSRAERLFVTFLGAEDSAYTRECTLLWLRGAVARAYCPGVKFDYMPVLIGAQGIGKSELCTRIAMSPELFSDGLTGIGKKESKEALRGKLILELSELTAVDSAKIESVKQFITSRFDDYRAPYAKTTRQHPRRCVLIGTTNAREFLKDDTGNRRFIPIECGVQEPTSNVFRHLNNAFVTQMWAEVLAIYKADPEAELVLSAEAYAQAIKQQEQVSFDDPRVGLIEGFLDEVIGKAKRHDQTPRVCVMQIIEDALDDELHMQDRALQNEVASIMHNHFPDWQRSDTKRNIGRFKRQRHFVYTK